MVTERFQQVRDPVHRCRALGCERRIQRRAAAQADAQAAGLPAEAAALLAVRTSWIYEAARGGGLVQVDPPVLHRLGHGEQAPQGRVAPRRRGPAGASRAWPNTRNASRQGRRESSAPGGTGAIGRRKAAVARVRQDRLLFEGLAGTEKTGTGAPDDPVQLSLARIRQLSAHEVGHALGLPHNMIASSSFPVDSLRSVSFTRRYGVSATIMDYARQNGFEIMQDAYPRHVYDGARRMNESETAGFRAFVCWSYQSGGGSARGRVIGRTDRIASTPVDRSTASPRLRAGIPRWRPTPCCGSEPGRGSAVPAAGDPAAGGVRRVLRRRRRGLPVRVPSEQRSRGRRAAPHRGERAVGGRSGAFPRAGGASGEAFFYSDSHQITAWKNP